MTTAVSILRMIPSIPSFPTNKTKYPTCERVGIVGNDAVSLVGESQSPGSGVDLSIQDDWYFRRPGAKP